MLICMSAFFRMVAGVTVTLTDKNIWSIPPQLRNPPTSIHILKIIGCTNLTRLVNNSFMTYPNLERLFVYENPNLGFIEEGAFNGLFVLERIKFRMCKLTQSPKALLLQPSMERVFVMGFSSAFAIRPQFQYPYFRGFPKLTDLNILGTKPMNFSASFLPAVLREIYLYWSDLNEMPDFSRYTPNIECINLAGNPLIGDFPMERIAGLTKLTWIRLDGYSLSSFDAPPTLVSLGELAIDNNQLTTISGLYNLPKLKILKLSNNKLKYVPDLFHLLLINSIQMGGNRWACDQDLCWLWALLFVKPGVIHKDHQLICASPPELVGRNFLSLREEDLGCQVSNFGK